VLKFDVVLTNPPFQDRLQRKKTPHKLWIEFTRTAFAQWLVPGGLLLQISPASFQSPSSKVLGLMTELSTKLINFNVADYFRGVGSSFAYYAIVNTPHAGLTVITKGAQTFKIDLSAEVGWLPTDLSTQALSIHRKVMWSGGPLLGVQHDYVTAHNTLLGSSLSKKKTSKYKYPVFHTNAQTWYSSVLQDWASKPKVMWSRSGYMKPRFDPGLLGGTDMVYYVEVKDARAGEALVANLELPLMGYIVSTAKWSGFGNEIVFHSLPELPTDRRLTQDELSNWFGLSSKEREYVERYLG
jgi:hypothetical protein